MELREIVFCRLWTDVQAINEEAHVLVVNDVESRTRYEAQLKARSSRKRSRQFDPPIYLAAAAASLAVYQLTNWTRGNPASYESTLDLASTSLPVSGKGTIVKTRNPLFVSTVAARAHAQLVTYRSRPVKRRRRVSRGLLLIFYAQHGQAGDQLVVTDEQWNRHGQVRYFPLGISPDVRRPRAFRPIHCSSEENPMVCMTKTVSLRDQYRRLRGRHLRQIESRTDAEIQARSDLFASTLARRPL